MPQRRRNKRRIRNSSGRSQFMIHYYRGVFLAGAGSVALTPKLFGMEINRPKKCLWFKVQGTMIPDQDKVKAVGGAELFTLTIFGPNKEQVNCVEWLVSSSGVHTKTIRNLRSTDFGMYASDDALMKLYDHGLDHNYGFMLYVQVGVLYKPPTSIASLVDVPKIPLVEYVDGRMRPKFEEDQEPESSSATSPLADDFERLFIGARKIFEEN